MQSSSSDSSLKEQEDNNTFASFLADQNHTDDQGETNDHSVLDISSFSRNRLNETEDSGGIGHTSQLNQSEVSSFSVTQLNESQVDISQSDLNETDIIGFNHNQLNETGGSGGICHSQLDQSEVSSVSVTQLNESDVDISHISQLNKTEDIGHSLCYNSLNKSELSGFSTSGNWANKSEVDISLCMREEAKLDVTTSILKRGHKEVEEINNSDDSPQNKDEPRKIMKKSLFCENRHVQISNTGFADEGDDDRSLFSDNCAYQMDNVPVGLGHINESPIQTNRKSFGSIVRMKTPQYESSNPETRLAGFLDKMYPGRSEKEKFTKLEDLIARCVPPETKQQKDRQLIHAVAKDIFSTIEDKKIPPQKRVHLLAILSKYMTREDAERLTSRNVSNNQWRAARQHYNIYGAGLPSEVKTEVNRRRRVEEKSIQEFVEWLNANDYLQTLAYGEKVVTISNGCHVAIEPVKRTESITNIMRNYYRDFLKDQIEGEEESKEVEETDRSVRVDENSVYIRDSCFSDYENEEDRTDGRGDICNPTSKRKRCSHICKNSKLRCFLDEHDDDKRHQFTPPDLLSPSTITKILLELSSGQIKSLAGLDNIAVMKGSENFEHMNQLVDIFTNMIGSDDAKANGENIKKQIKETKEFHQVDFCRHLESGNCKCMCIKCGLRCEKEDDIQCESRDTHTAPCKLCQDAFDLLTNISGLCAEAETVAMTRYTEMPALEDDIDNWKAELQTCLRNLIDYRAHLVHKHSEALFDSEFYSNLADDEAVVICDWKMKILSSKFREAQAEWFSKRGMSLLGFEIHLKSENEDERRVLYHFFVSDDTTQDTEAVLCAKHYLYMEVLPSYGVKRVKFRSDGAMCFSSKEAKSFITVWDDLAQANSKGAYETSYKVSVSGCGKTALDVSYSYSMNVIHFYIIYMF